MVHASVANPEYLGRVSLYPCGSIATARQNNYGLRRPYRRGTLSWQSGMQRSRALHVSSDGSPAGVISVVTDTFVRKLGAPLFTHPLLI